MKKISLLVAFCYLIMGALSAPASAQSVPRIQFEKYKLPNGLEVILHEDHSTPIVAVDTWYHVGSGDEQVGRTGFAHLFEHIMFMGSQHVPVGAFDQLLETLPDKQARMIRAQRVFELGSGFGYSTIWFAKAVRDNGGGEVYHTVWDDDLSRLDYAVLLSRQTVRVIQQNIAVSLGVKAVALALAATGGLPLWGAILAERLCMYQKLRSETETAGTPSGHDDFYKSYVLFVGLVQKKLMGGSRFTALKST